MAKLAAALDGAGAGRRWAGVPFVFIDGSTDAVDRRAACRRFRDDPAVRVALLSITAAGTGLDFSAASGVVFVELPDEVALVRQAEDRAHRHGQRRAVNVYFLIARGTSDERRWQLLDRSLERVTAVHDGGDTHGGAPGDARGIALDAVCEAGGADGWGSAVECQGEPGPGLGSGSGSALGSASSEACAALVPSGGAGAPAPPCGPGAKALQDPSAGARAAGLTASEPGPAHACRKPEAAACVSASAGDAGQLSSAHPLRPVPAAPAAAPAGGSLSASSSVVRLSQAGGLVDDEVEWVSDSDGEGSPGCGRPSAARSRVFADPVPSLGSGPHAADSPQPPASQAGDSGPVRAADGLAPLRCGGTGVEGQRGSSEEACGGAAGAAQSVAPAPQPCRSAGSAPCALAHTTGDGTGGRAAGAAGGGAALPDVAGATDEERPKVSRPMLVHCDTLGGLRGLTE